jgi:hypothetical protein
LRLKKFYNIGPGTQAYSTTAIITAVKSVTAHTPGSYFAIETFSLLDPFVASLLSSSEVIFKKLFVTVTYEWAQ